MDGFRKSRGLKMRAGMLLATALGLVQSGAALAEDITFQLNNASARPVVAVYATPKGDSTAAEISLVTGGEIGAAGAGEVSFAPADSVCVYDLRIQFGDGVSVERPDVDLCHTDELVID
jgi:hypothetical protein